MSYSPGQPVIRISADGRYFVDADNAPFFWLGDTAWPLFTQYKLSEAERYLADRAAKGFTVVQAVLVWSGGTGFESKTPAANENGEIPWLETPTEPNPAYFQYVDRLIELAASLNLILAIVPAWGYFVTDVQVITSDNARSFGTWLGQRYRDRSNIVWLIGGDRVPTGFEDVYREMAIGLRDGAEGAHLITYHPCGWRSSSQFFQEEPWLDFNMIQTWTEWAKVYPAVLTDNLLVPRKPVVLGEGAYEDGTEYPLGPISPLVIRRQAWWAFMAGGYYTNGQNLMWRMDEGWLNSLNSPGAKQMVHFKRIATLRDWWLRVPDQGLFASGVSSERTLNTAIRSIHSDWAMAYLSSPCHVLLHIDKILTKQVKTTWINPQNGETADAGSFLTGNLNDKNIPLWNTQWFSTPPFWEDAVLLLDGFSH